MITHQVYTCRCGKTGGRGSCPASGVHWRGEARKVFRRLITGGLSQADIPEGAGRRQVGNLRPGRDFLDLWQARKNMSGVVGGGC